ncbi:MAG TPA: POTRA domain-containing protein [Terracidiphilus sp.]|jgi:outer membrane protein insertion porin family|nr:POTRA domain-containing protein [Terracidiphilus sp.]
MDHRSKVQLKRFPRFRHHARLLLCILFLLPTWKTTVAQQGSQSVSPDARPSSDEGDILASYEGQNVSSIQVAGRPGFTAAQYTQYFVQQVGQPFSKENVEKTAAALKAGGHFAAVQTEVEPQINGIGILFVVKPTDFFGIFTFPGAQRFPYSQLLQAANFPVQEAFNQEEVEKDAHDLVTFYQQEGYFTAATEPQVDTEVGHAIANVQFRTTLGVRAKFGSIDIQGAPDDDNVFLQHKLMSLSARLRAAAIRPGKTYHHSTLTKANAYLQKLLEKQGYLGAQVKLSGAEFQSASNRADIHFSIDPGAPTTVRIEGAHLWPWTRNSLLPIYQGIGVDDESVNEGQQALISYFQAKGFFDVKVESQLNNDQKRALVLYRITREKKHKVAGIALSGNKALPSSELTPRIAVAKKRLFSPGKFSDQLVQASVKNLKAVYESEGFSSVQVTSVVARSQGDVQVSFRVVEGPRDVVNSLAIDGARTFPQAQFAPGGLKVAVGQPYSQSHVQQDRASILANYLKAGYLMAGLRETARQVSKSEPHRIDVVYHIHEGPRVITGDVLTLGRFHTDQRLINSDTAEIKSGQPLTESALLGAGSRLYDHTGVFDWAEIDPKEPITTQDSDDVLVKVHEAKRNEFTYGLGFEVIERGGSIPSGTVALPNLPPIGLPANFTTSETTFYGPRGTIEYTRNNLRGKGESLSFTGFAGRLDQRGAFYYVDPSFRWSSWKATSSVSVERNEQNPIFSSQEEQATVQFQRPLDRAKKDIFFAQYGFSQVDLPRVLIPSLVPAQDQHVRLSTVSANITRDTRDNPLDEHKGVLESMELDFNTSKLGSSVDFAKLTGQAAIYREKFHHIIWASSLRIGLAQPFNNSFVPLSEAFFSGGGNSLRGFPLDGAGPQRQVDVCSTGSSTDCEKIKVPAGGNEMVIVNAEARIPLPIKKGLSFVTFYDGGNVFPNVGFHDFASLYSNNVGVGIRFATPVGPIRFDLGQNLNPVSGIKSTQYFVGIGQAF